MTPTPLTLTVPYVEDNGVYFTTGIMSDKANAIDVLQSLSGHALFVMIKDRKYRVDVADIATAIAEQERNR
jgi:hypothetical protein